MPILMGNTDGNSNVGTVIRCQDRSARGMIAPLKFDPALSYDAEWVIINDVKYSPQESVQFQASTGTEFTIYTFGSLPSQLRISGMCFARKDCRGDGVTHGLAKLFRWWDSNRASVREEPIGVTFADKLIKTFAVDATFAISDAATFIAQFSIGLVGMPDGGSPVAPPAEGSDEGSPPSLTPRRTPGGLALSSPPGF